MKIPLQRKIFKKVIRNDAQRLNQLWRIGLGLKLNFHRKSRCGPVGLGRHYLQMLGKLAWRK
jgi:hypothetical protein